MFLMSLGKITNYLNKAALIYVLDKPDDYLPKTIYGKGGHKGRKPALEDESKNKKNHDHH